MTDNTVPDDTVPDSTVPDNTAPDNTVPDNTAPGEGGSPLAIRMLAGNPTATELAAVAAVLSALAADEGGKRMPVVPSARSAWSFSQRQLRSEIVPGPGAWTRHRL